MAATSSGILASFSMTAPSTDRAQNSVSRWQNAFPRSSSSGSVIAAAWLRRHLG